MSDTDKNKSSTTKPAPSGDKTTSGGRRSAWQENKPVIRFVFLFLVVLIILQVLYYEFIVHTSPFGVYLGISGRIAAFLLGIIGQETTTAGDRLTSAGFTISIRAGCDGLQAIGILVTAVVLFPSHHGKKLAGIAIGLVLLVILNIIRIGSLVWFGVHFHALFEAIHLHIWPSFMTFCSLVFFVIWAVWVTQPRAVASAPLLDCSVQS